MPMHIVRTVTDGIVSVMLVVLERYVYSRSEVMLRQEMPSLESPYTADRESLGRISD